MKLGFGTSEIFTKVETYNFLASCYKNFVIGYFSFGKIGSFIHLEGGVFGLLHKQYFE